MSERGLRVQPAGGRAVVGREDRRASLPATRASGGMARLGAPPLLGEADQHVAAPDPSRREMSPLRQEPKLIRWARKVELARRHRSSLDENTPVSPEVRTIARSDREHRGPSPRQFREQASRRGAEELVVDTGVGVLRRDLGWRLAGRVSKVTLLDRASLPERNALRSRRPRSMMLGVDIPRGGWRWSKHSC